MDFMRLSALFFFLLTCSGVKSQATRSITGIINGVPNKEIVLKGYYLSDQKILSRTLTDGSGSFTLNYPLEYIGAAILDVAGSQSVIVLLNKENFALDWSDISRYDKLIFKNSKENLLFNEGLELYRVTEERKAGLKYLIPLYSSEPEKQHFLQSEFDSQNASISRFMQELPADSYAKLYLKLRKLLSDIPLNLNSYQNLLPESIDNFNKLDFKDPGFIQSGLAVELIDAYVTMTESLGSNQYEYLNGSIDQILMSIGTNNSLKQDIARHMFDTFEKRSLFKASEYLALKMLDDQSCTMDDNHKALFEQYRKMKVGNTAPDISFGQVSNGLRNLYGVKSSFKLVVFGASWCPKCSADIPDLEKYYPRWKSTYGLEAIFVSLDTDLKEHKTFTSRFPWLVTFEGKGWESNAVKDYCVFATPTFYLLDSGNKILLKPVSFDQIEAWLSVNVK